MREVRLGTEEHKKLLCREFVDTFTPYEVDEVRWPDLDAASVERLRALPFWGEAVTTERTAGARVRCMADVEKDPLLREAIAMQGYEETRHAALLERMLAHYGIEVPEGGGEKPRDAEWGFMRMGYGETFDSFFAFGLFKIAADTGFFPKPLLAVFDGVMQEEARHILFFTNWAAYHGKQLGLLEKPGFMLRRAMGMGLQALGRVRTALQLRDTGASDDFTMQVPDAIDTDVTLRSLAEVCLAENDLRLARYDPRLRRPKLVPSLVRRVLPLIPGAAHANV
jgi:hypothetical protein